MAQARAFLELRMMDRAWVRLKEVGHRVEAQVLTARMFIERGWPKRAQRILEPLLAEYGTDPEVQALWARSEEPPVIPDELETSDIELDIALPVAEAQLAAGAFIKAQKVLERLKRHHPEEKRVADLLWVLAGDYGVDGATLAELADSHGPDLSLLADLGDDAEHTESVEIADLRPDEPPDPVRNSAFASLFRSEEEEEAEEGLEESTPNLLGEAREVTHVSALADLQALREAEAPAPTTADDTQIVRVIERGAPNQPVGGPMHLAAELEPSFDLAAFRQEMGMQYTVQSDIDDEIEEEDDELIILTQRDAEPTEELSTGFDLLEPDPTTGGMVQSSEVDAEAPTVVRKPNKKRHRGSNTPWWLLAMAMLLLGATGLVMILVLLSVLSSTP